ncbi:MAG: NAD(P)-dependent oxidoreductase, partial [Pacificimonas sp.]
DQTRNILSRENLAKTKPGVRIINCARGGLIDEAALKEMLDSGHVAGAALDVFVEEPAKQNVLFGTPGFVATPHLGASTDEAQVNVAIQVAEQMSDFLLTGAVTNALNTPSVSAEEAPKLKPYMTLATKLGLLAGQLMTEGVTRVSVEAEGALAGLNLKPVTAAVLAGMLRPISDSVNMVNAPFMARERDIDVAEVRHDREGDYASLLRLTVEDAHGTRSVAGTLFGDNAPRLVELFGIRMEAELEGAMLFIENEDKPGFIGAVGSSLGQAGVNIGTFNLGRRAGGNDAVMLVAVDDVISEPLLWQICKLDGVKNVKALNF